MAQNIQHNAYCYIMKWNINWRPMQWDSIKRESHISVHTKWIDLIGNQYRLWLGLQSYLPGYTLNEYCVKTVFSSPDHNTTWRYWYTGPWFNIKMTSYQYRKSHCGDKTILRPSYLHNGISYTGKTTYLYWIRCTAGTAVFVVWLLSTYHHSPRDIICIFDNVWSA